MFATVVSALILSGCVHQPSPYASDPRCRGLRPVALYPWVHQTGPNYLDYVMEYPRDRVTEADRPSIYLQGRQARYLDPFAAPTNAPAEIQALLTPVPPARLN